MFVIAHDLGGTKLASAVFNLKGEMFNLIISPLKKKEGAEVGNMIIEHTKQLLAYSKENNLDIKTIGVSVPGISYSSDGTVWAPNIPGWEKYPLKKELSEIVENKIPVFIDSDRACYILGEFWLGNAKGCKDAIFLAVGTGIGAGIMINGTVLRGSNDIAGAVGWLALNKPFEEKYVQCGCYEYNASGAGLAKVAHELLTHNNHYTGILREKNIHEISAKDLFEAYEFNDTIAVQVLNQAIEYWGMCVANLVSIFNPEKIIFGGGVFGPGCQFLNKIYYEARKWAQPIAINQVKLEGSALGSDSGLIGAAYLAIQNS